MQPHRTATRLPAAARCSSRHGVKTVERKPTLAEQSLVAWLSKGRRRCCQAPGLCDPHPRTRLLVVHEEPPRPQLPVGLAGLIWNPVPSSAVAWGRRAHP